MCHLILYSIWVCSWLLDIPIYVPILVGNSIIVDCVYQFCMVIINRYDTMVDILLLNMMDLEVILGIN